MRIGHGYDVPPFGRGPQAYLRRGRVPYEKGLLGHSDADVLLHAVMDAVLGAAAHRHRPAFPRYRPPRLQGVRTPWR